MVSLAGRFTNLVFRLMPHDKEGEVHDYVAERKRNDIRPPRLPKGVSVEAIDLHNDQPAEYIFKKGNDKGTIFFIHGGGFTTGTAKERRIFTYYAVDHCGYNCIAINYRLAPENRWPAQIEDCYKAYEEVLKKGYKADELVFVGDSAGGTLVLSLALLASQRGLPQPKGIIAFSPLTDQYRDLPSHKGKIRTDCMLRDGVGKGIAKQLFDHEANEEELSDPLVSPYYGNYDNIAPIFLSASDSETLYDDTIILYEKLRNEDHKVELDVDHGVCHAYPILSYMPEARTTIAKAFAFIESN